jgi:two-component system phosphate regulon response regulator OmpR
MPLFAGARKKRLAARRIVAMDQAGKAILGGRQRIVIVDDEPEFRATVAEYLAQRGFTVLAAAGGTELDAIMAQGMPDLVILDVNMPGENGFAVARRLRATSDVPFLMLTVADDIVDRVVGLELGADDYISKPFDLRELRARVDTILRRASRARAAPNAAAARSPALVRIGDFNLDVDARRLSRPNGEEVELTAAEFDLLFAFARNPNRVLSRDRLLELAHHHDTEPFDRSIDVRVTRLRHKIERDPSKPLLIKTMRGAGYMFVPSDS